MLAGLGGVAVALVWALAPYGAAPLPPVPAVPREAPAPDDAGAPAAAAPVDAGQPLAAAAPVSEEGLLSRLRYEADPRPAAALELAQQSERLFPAGRHTDERSYLKMRALVHLGEIAAARDEATAFFERTPDSPFAEQVYRLTGVHPRPRPPR